MFKFFKKDIDPLAVGATLLGTGGGGDPSAGVLLLQLSMNDEDYIEILDPSEVPDDATLCCVAYMGSPTVGLEKLENKRELLLAFEQLQKYLNIELFGVLPAEVGGANCLTPLHVALEKKLPVVDADGLGRAFPRSEQSTFGLHNISLGPISQADEKGNSIILNPIDNEWGEKLASATLLQMGGQTANCDFSMTGKQLKKAAVKNTISLALKIGRNILHARESGEDINQAVVDATNGFLLFQGKVKEVISDNGGRFNIGKCVIYGNEAFEGRILEIEFQNEYMLATDITKQKILAMAPDLITVYNTHNGQAVVAEMLRYGSQLSVVGIPCDRQWRSKEGIALAGIKSFGYEHLDYIPIEELNQ